jgi:hypothetical protein
MGVANWCCVHEKAHCSQLGDRTLEIGLWPGIDGMMHVFVYNGLVRNNDAAVRGV